MSRSNRQASIVANPVLVGAVTTLVVVVAVFLAYNANNGLPFVPTTELRLQVANGANLLKGNEVREGGFRVGIVQELVPVRLPDGSIGASVRLKIDEAAGDIPIDSTARIRARSALGLKYVELTRGLSRETLPDGGTLRAEQTSSSTELDTFFSTFDEDTREASQRNLEGFGNAFAGRGGDLNQTIQDLPELLRSLEPVMRNLSADRTDLEGFVQELAQTARIVAPVSEVQAALFTEMADTFEAIGRDEQALQDTIAKSPPTLDVATRSLRAQRPFLRNTASFSRDLSLAAVDLRAALPTVNEAIEVGTPVTRRTVELNEELQETFTTVRELTDAPATNTALRALSATVGTLQPQLKFLGPHVTVCNRWNYFWTFVAEHFTAPDPTGGSQRALANGGSRQADDVGNMGANEFANGQDLEPDGTPQYLHGNWYGAAVDDEGRADCEAGQQGYAFQGNRFDPSPDRFYSRAVVDTHDRDENGRLLTGPGALQGPLYRRFDRNGPDEAAGLGPARVPEGMTFTREPGGRGAQIELP